MLMQEGNHSVQTVTHPAIALRAGHARLTGTIPSLVVCGGDERSREVTADLYVRALIKTGALSRRKAGQVAWAREEALPVRRSLEHEELAQCPLLVLAEVGAVVREDPPGGQPDGWPVGTEALGQATSGVVDLLLARAEHRPTIVTTSLPVGNPPLTGSDLDRAYFNYALHKAVEERGQVGWPAPSHITGFDPDARIVEAGTATLQAHLGPALWWRLYLSTLATAIDAAELQTG